MYRVSGDTSGHVDAQTQPREVVFEYEDAGGLVVKKTLQFEPQRHVVRLTALVRSGQSALNPTVMWGPGLGDIGATSGGGSFFTGNYVQPPQAIYQRDGEVERHAADALNTQPVHEGNFRFLGMDDHYFIVDGCGCRPGASRIQATDAAQGPARRSACSSRSPSRSRSRRRTSSSSSVRSSSTRCKALTPSSSARSTSGCSPGWWCRC